MSPKTNNAYFYYSSQCAYDRTAHLARDNAYADNLAYRIILHYRPTTYKRHHLPHRVFIRA